jgi:hypothetical protein
MKVLVVGSSSMVFLQSMCFAVKSPKAQFSNNPTCSRFNMNRRRAHRSYSKGISKLITIGRGMSFEFLETYMIVSAHNCFSMWI